MRLILKTLDMLHRISEGKQQMLGFEHFESLEALRDFGALQAELGRTTEESTVKGIGENMERTVL